VAALALGTTGCTFFAPQATLNPFDASDGISATIGDVEIRNALAISADGVDANVVMVIINSGDTGQTVEFQYDDNSSGSPVSTNVDVPIPAGGVLSLGTKDTPQLVLRGADVKPGALLPVFVQYGDETGQKMLLPVLDDNGSTYAGLLPSPAPTPTPTDIPTPLKTAKPASN
jgi:hypothetical protein